SPPGPPDERRPPRPRARGVARAAASSWRARRPPRPRRPGQPFLISRPWGLLRRIGRRFRRWECGSLQAAHGGNRARWANRPSAPAVPEPDHDALVAGPFDLGNTRRLDQLAQARKTVVA